MSVPEMFETGDDFALPWERDAVVRDVIANDMAVTFSQAPEPPTIASDLKRHTVKLATLRVELAARDEALRVARQAFEATLSEQLRNREALRRELDATEDTVRALALVEYETTGRTKPCPGISVVISKEYEVDEASALTWAKTTRMCLVPEQLDLKSIKKMATVTDLPFVTVTERPAVRVASDLVKALGEAA